MESFLKKLSQLNLFLIEKDGDLILKGKKGKLTKVDISIIKQNNELIDFIKTNKQALIQYLKVKNTANRPLKESPISAIYELSPMQEGMLFHSVYEEGTNAYIEQLALDLPEGIEEEACRFSWEFVLQNHSILRSNFIYDKVKLPVQCVHKKINLPFEVLDFREYTKTEQTNKIATFRVEDKKKGFDLAKPPLMRITLIRLNSSVYKMIWTHHHLLLDGWSMPILMKEWLTAYEAFKRKEIPSRPPEDLFEPYIRYLQGQDKTVATNFWKTYLASFEQPTLLPFTSKEGDRNKGAKSSQTIEWNAGIALSKQIKTYVQKYHLTMNTFVQGVWAFILSKYTNSSEIVFGVTVSGRPTELEGAEHKIGLFINTIPLLAKVNGKNSFKDYFKELQITHTQARDYSYSSLTEIQNGCGLKGDFFDSLLVFENYPLASVLKENKVLALGEMESEEHTNYLLTIIARSTSELSLTFSFNQALLTRESVQMIQKHFARVIQEIISEKKEKLATIGLLSPKEEELILEFNGIKQPPYKGLTSLDLFQNQVNEHPHKTALIFNEVSLSYQELDEKANQLGHYLQKQGVKEEQLVAICLPRSSEMIIAILAILKAGGAYIPIDVDYPKERILYILEDAKPSLLITQDTQAYLEENTSATKFLLSESIAGEIEQESTQKVVNQLTPESLMYVIYTSGSTGKPKGAMIEHKSNVNMALEQTRILGITPNDNILQFASLSFDASISEICMALISGATLTLVDKETIGDGTRMIAYMREKKVNVVTFPPVYLNILDLRKLDFLRLIISAGEAANVQQAILVNSFCTYFNAYGPTECAVCVSMYPFSEGDKMLKRLPIGQPLANTVVYILDSDLQLLPIGVAGEIWVSGVGVARGYLNRPTLTAEKFIPSPFKKEIGDKLYRTGDVGRWLPDGNMEFLGRVDHQVKIRGHRIEIGEIETTILASKLVQQCIVLAKKGKNGDRQLVAYLVPLPNYEQAVLQEYLKAQLPDFMLPALLIKLDNFPITTNGKVDIKALPNPGDYWQTKNQYVAPRNEIETKLSQIWSQLLGIEEVGIKDNFFEIGGHSLLATRAISAIRKTFAKSISIKALFTHPTIAELSVLISNGTQNKEVKLLKSEVRPAKIPLSFAQERMWFIDQLQGSVNYHLPTLIRLKGILEVDKLEAAFKILIHRHEVLRTIYLAEEGTPFQKIITNDTWQLKTLIRRSNTAELKQFIKKQQTAIFDLAKDFPIRVVLIQLSDQEHLLSMVLHHIAADGWSMALMVKELLTIYRAKLSSTKSPLKPLPIQYADYAIWQQKNLKGAVLDKQLTYWKNQLKDIVPLNLPTDFPRPIKQSSKGDRVWFKADKGLSSRIKRFSQQQETTLFMTLLAGLKVLLSRYTRQKDISVGSPIANRTQSHMEPLMGYFANTLVLRSNLEGNPSFQNLLQQVKSTTLTAYEHQATPFEKIVEQLELVRDQSRSPLFQVLFVLHNNPDLPNLKMGSLEAIIEQETSETSKFDLSFSVKETEEGFAMEIEYCSDLFQQATIERMSQQYLQLLEAAIQAPQTAIGQLPMIAEREKSQLLHNFNSTAIAYPEGKTLIDLLETQRIKTPNKVAIVFEEQFLTYQQLADKSNQLGHFLQKKGVQKETLVGICLERSLKMMIGLLGIMKAGGAYVPIDPIYPKARIDYLLEDAQIRYLLVDKSCPIGNPTQIETIHLEEDWSLIEKESKAPLQLDLTSENLAYVIYTSGSTGRPKGVMNQHSGVVNRLLWAQDYFKLESDSDVVLQKTTFCFDVSVWELFWPLIAGVKLVFAKPEGHKDSQYLRELIEQTGITTIHFVPSMLSTFLLDIPPQSCKKLKRVLCSGEALKLNHIQSFQEKLQQAELYNLYGPTEAAIDVTACEIPEYASLMTEISIGKPVANTQIYILNQAGNIAPIGVPGELVIGGIQVARGYLNRPELTKEKFIKNPFEQQSNTKLYCTGDLAKWLPNGTISFLGRLDTQVKIRGFRVELGEIESVIQQSPTVKQCIVLAKEGLNGYKKLVAYLVPVSKTQTNIDKEKLREFLLSRLPEYMVPSLMMEIPALPLTTNGKINKKALPEVEGTALISRGYVAPNSTTQQQLVEIWQSLLEINQIGIHDNFFELGGHSLLAARVIAAIRKTLKVEISLKEIFDKPTIATLATYIDKEGVSANLPPIETQNRPERIPLSFAQERLWFIDQLQGSINYHIPTVLQLHGSVQAARLEATFQEIIQRQEVLRTVYRKEEGKPYQVVLEKNDWRLAISEENVTEHYIQQLIATPFDLSNDYMLRAHLIRQPNGQQVLIVVLHHIASDGWSMSILVRELMAIYQAKISNQTLALPAMGLQYIDYALWQKQQLAEVILGQKMAYWENQLADLTTLNLPLDFPRPPIQSFAGASIDFKIDKALSQQLKTFSNQEGVTLFMTLLAIFKVLLYQYSGQSDICVGSPIANRKQASLEPLIGFFTNMLALRSDLSGNPTFKAFLADLRKTTITAYDHQEVPLEKIVDKVVKNRDRSRTPLFQTLFVFQNNPVIPQMKLGAVKLSPIHFTNQTAKYDLTFDVKETSEGLSISIEYCTALFEKTTIERMKGHYQTLVSAIIENAAQPIAQLSMLTPFEKSELLNHFNDTDLAYPKDKTLVALLAEQVIKSPNNTAIVFEEKEISYQELEAKSNQLGHFLQEKGIGNGSTVLLCMDRSIEMMIGLIGILKAGAAYIPVDPTYPEERIRFIMEDAEVTLALSNKKYEHLFTTSQTTTPVFIEEIGSILATLPNDRLNIRPSSSDLAYLIYTSGSTGRPKGVMINHQALLNFLCSMAHQFELDATSSILAITTISFDIAYLELYLPLINGGKVFLADKTIGLDVFGLQGLLAKHQPSHLQATPATWQLLIDSGWENEEQITLLTGGEAIKEPLKEALVKISPNQVWNMYGPTETTIWSASKALKQGEKVNIGNPIGNTQLYILKQTGALSETSLVPIGVVGELCIGGDGLAMGYLNRPGLTAEKFVKNPFSSNENARLYRTGDLGRWLPNGEVDCLGRMDNQVKVRGFRIELGEIEAILLTHSLVKQCVVIAKIDTNGHKRLIAYVVSETTLEQEVMRIFLQAHLPAYMIPSLFLTMANLPLTPNGKVDKLQLPDPDTSRLSTKEYVAPRNEIETALVVIWQKLLQVEKLGIYDNFFDLGGHSLLIVQLIAAIQSEFGLDIPIKTLFEFTCIADLGAYIQLVQSTTAEQDMDEFSVFEI